jgi:hypothetical protein
MGLRVYARPVGEASRDRPRACRTQGQLRFAAGSSALLLSIVTADVAAAQTNPENGGQNQSSTPASPPRTTVAPPSPSRTAPESSPPESIRFAQDLEKTPPPPSHVVYFQYGVAFTTEQIVAPGPICDSTGAPCILGAGGGIVVRGGWRSTGPLYIGLAYELTKQDPNKLYRIALLQQARAEARYYFMTARVTEPYVSASAGVAGYGNEWAIDTWGPGGSLGAGVEYQVTRRTLVGLGLAYRLLYLGGFKDTAGTDRAAGIAQLVGLDLVLEQRDAIVTDGADQVRSR